MGTSAAQRLWASQGGLNRHLNFPESTTSREQDHCDFGLKPNWSTPIRSGDAAGGRRFRHADSRRRYRCAGRSPRSSSHAFRIQDSSHSDGRELVRCPSQRGRCWCRWDSRTGAEGDYTLSSVAGDELRIENVLVGRIAPGQWRDTVPRRWRHGLGGGSRPYTVFKADSAWHHRESSAPVYANRAPPRHLRRFT